MAWCLGLLPALANEPGPALSEGAKASEITPTASSADPLEGAVDKPNAEPALPHQPSTSLDPMGQSTAPEESVEPKGKGNLPPLTPELANLNLAEDLELMTLDTNEKVFLPAGTYRQILRVPIDSPTMQSIQKTRQERRPEVKVPAPLPSASGPEKKPLWIRYESLEKIKINEEERRGGLDVPINGPPGLKIRLWYAKSETADTASSVFYFLFGGLGYSTANILGWSAGNTREIPANFEYRLVRR